MQSEKRYDVTAFGESMLRLSVPSGKRMAAMRSLDVYFGGAESNVLAGLACLGHRCGWFGALPESEIGRFAIRQLQMANVVPQPIVVQDGRIGTYYVEFAPPPRNTQVIYDRAHAAITQLTPDQIAYNALLNTRILHLTGITPALAPTCLTITQALIAQAQTADVPISFDVNFRSKLWSAAEAGETLRPLIQNVDLLLCSKRDAESLFGCSGTAEQTIEQLATQTNARQIVVTMGNEGVFGWDGTNNFHEPARPVTIIDRIGAGDALAAGVIHGWLQGDLQLGLQHGTLLAALALGQHGDMLVTSADEVANLLNAEPTAMITR